MDVSAGVLLTSLTTPPVVPRPKVTADGPSQHLHFFLVECVAVVAAEIAHAVEENVVARREAANRQVVALRAAFAGRQADACHVAQRVAQRGGVLLGHDLLRHHADRLRRVQSRLGVLAGGHLSSVCGVHGDRLLEGGSSSRAKSGPVKR